MDDEQTTTETTTTTETKSETPPAKQERTYTAAEVENIVKDRLARAKPKAPEPDKKTSSKADTTDPTWVFDLQDAIDAQTEERGVKVPLGLKKRMRAAYAAEKPQDPTAWVSGWLDDVGLVKKSETTTTNDKAGDKKAESPPPQTTKPISDKGSPTVTRDLEEISNPNDLTQVDIDRLYAKHGEDKGNDLISKMVLKWAEGVRIVPDRGQRR